MNKFFDETNWTFPPRKTWVRGGLNPNEVGVHCGHTFGADKNIINKITIKIGEEVMKELGWQQGDKIIPMMNPDDHLVYLLVKSDNGAGYTISKEGSTRIHSVTFKYFGDVTLEKRMAKPVNFAVNGKKLVFEIRD